MPMWKHWLSAATRARSPCGLRASLAQNSCFECLRFLVTAPLWWSMPSREHRTFAGVLAPPARDVPPREHWAAPGDIFGSPTWRGWEGKAVTGEGPGCHTHAWHLQDSIPKTGAARQVVAVRDPGGNDWGAFTSMGVPAWTTQRAHYGGRAGDSRIVKTFTGFPWKALRLSTDVSVLVHVEDCSRPSGSVSRGCGAVGAACCHSTIALVS